MTIAVVVQVFILVSVLFVAAELYVLIRELGRFLRLYPEEREAHDAPRAGQTINVNLSPVSTPGQAIRVSEGEGERVAVQASAPSEGARPAEKKAGDESSQPEPRAGKKTGAFAVECPRCHAENSSYRVECYNCGNPL
ncbi:MAG TPA: hypothetical protein PK542_09905 [Treponemataceae bacterium]|nr:hypothetical protein [Treponemataceae bacterium]HPS44788.1 hypothetical protein [Treponemataceae bacterium]